MSTISSYIEEYLNSSKTLPSQQVADNKWRRHFLRGLAVALPLIGAVIIVRNLLPQNDAFVEPAVFDAVSTGQIDETQELIARTPSLLSQFDLEGNTLLYTAVLTAKPQIVELLLSKGADPNTANATGDFPLAAALRGSHHAWPMAKMLLEHGALAGKTLPNGGNALHLAARLRQYDRHVMIMLAHDRAALHAHDQDGLIPQQVAQKQGSFELARLLAQAD